MRHRLSHSLLAVILLALPLSGQAAMPPEAMAPRELEPVGGTVMQPESWHFHRQPDRFGHTWIIAREPAKRYETGLRIQLVTGTQRYLKDKPKDFATKFLADKKRTTKTLAAQCDDKAPAANSLCLETEETIPYPSGNKLFRILYKVQWYDELDSVVVYTAGAPAADWATWQPVLAAMLAGAPLNFSKVPLPKPDTSGQQCSWLSSDSEQRLAYAGKFDSNDDNNIVAVSALGSHDMILDGTYNLMTPEELVARIKAGEHYGQAKLIMLLWPYSGLKDASFKRRVAELTGKSVFGVNGQLWLYANGSMAITDPYKTRNSYPTDANITQCLTSDAVIHPASECKKLLPQNEKPIFSNGEFALSCAEIAQFERDSVLGDSIAAMKLFFFNKFVNVDNEKSALLLAQAALSGFDKAQYMMALFLKDNPKQQQLYRQFLQRAAQQGHEPAIERLRAEHLE